MVAAAQDISPSWPERAIAPARPTVAHRLEVRDVLTPMQARVLEIVHESPGCSIQTVAIRLRFVHATASYHLHALVKAGCIVQVRDGREVRNFPAALTKPGEYLQALVADRRKAALVELLCGQPVERLTIHQISKAIAISFPFVKRTLQQLEWAGFLGLERRRYRYSVRLSIEQRAVLRTALERAALGPI